MTPRRLIDLCQLSEDTFFIEVGEGLRLCLLNALRLWRECETLRRAKRAQSLEIIRLLVEEETAKFFILLDAVRCPRQHTDFTRLLNYFRNHLSRGLYVTAYEFPAQDLTRIKYLIDLRRRAFYLDGPNDVDWIFRNEIEQRREEAMYVDYVHHHDTFRDEHKWHLPDQRFFRIRLRSGMPYMLQTASAIHRVGMITPESLRVIANLWRGEAITDDFTWERSHALNHQTLQHLNDADLLVARQREQRIVVGEWRPPLYALDLRVLPVEIADLQAEQANWTPYDWDY